ncbi:hypothetical protein [Planktothrix agardhii]|uniref:hypothetical protein n=1 Tax=Planktothrix agardhii TaxID=1160 RepID=UPI00041343C6|nr:hypothetical protein [Planktothrix agardhii]CAD0232358.1 conserved hypothetical protein [Planktothrix agardhii]CAD5931810.1 hypothetical protein NO758_01323 [Planktothrix agardhii]
MRDYLIVILYIEQLENIETLDEIKNVLETAIAKSTYLSDVSSNQRPLQIRWKLGFEIDLDIIKTCCSTGYAPFTKGLTEAAKVVMDVLD